MSTLGSPLWAAQHITWLLIKLTLKGVVFPFDVDIDVDVRCWWVQS